MERMAWVNGGVVTGYVRCDREQAEEAVKLGLIESYLVLRENEACEEGWAVDRGALVRPEARPEPADTLREISTKLAEIQSELARVVAKVDAPEAPSLMARLFG